MSKILAVIFFLGLIFLASCNTSQPTNVQEEPSMLKGKVIGYEGSGHLLEAISNDRDDNVLGKGDIDGEGNFTLELDDPLPSELLGNTSFCSGIDESIQSIGTSTIWVKDGNTIVGLIGQASSRSLINKTTTLGKIGIRMFVEQAQDIIGTGNCEGTSFKFNLQFQKGWNIVIAENNDKTGASMYTASSTSDLKWFYIPQ